MVKNSLKSLLDKFPYFLNKNEGSNFFKVQNVNNESLKLVYNDLFQVYESFHLNKRLLVWKEQTEPYNYHINFVANYPNLKSVKIYKNNEAIYIQQYPEEDEVDSFEWTYICWYGKSNIPRNNVYICNTCEELYPTMELYNYEQIYFSEETPDACHFCSGHDFHTTNVFRCEDCGEIYFSDNPPATCPGCNHTNITQVYAYKCSKCGQIYIGQDSPELCETCGTRAELDLNTLINFNDEDIQINDNSMSFDEVIFREETEIATSTRIVRASFDDEVIVEPYLTVVSDDESFDEDIVPAEISKDEVLKINIPKIPTDRFIIEVETWDEYSLVKGFPENDISKGDEFDHDPSLDEFGALNQIPRKEYIELVNTDLYHLTEPPYNDRLSEDDYHYMNRIIEYNLRLFNTPAPVLEIWKLYGLEATLLNRERLLLKLFDVKKHNSSNNQKDTDLVECWIPEAWEHKDKFHECSVDLGTYFFAEVDTVQPVPWQNVYVDFKILNSLAREVDIDYTVDIYHYLFDDAETSKTLLAQGYEEDNAIISYKVFNSNKLNVLRFEAHDTQGNTIGTSEIYIKVRGCNDGDWYVASNGNDTTGDGSSARPFRTISKALSVVNNALDLIVIKGNITLNDAASIPVVNVPCTLMGCENASITSNYQRQFFHINGERDIKVRLVNLTLRNEDLVSTVNTVEFNNQNNNFTNFETVTIHGGKVILTANINTTNVYPYDYVNITGDLKTKEGTPLADKKLSLTLEDGTVIGEITTDSNGTFDEWIKLELDEDVNSFKLQLIFDNDNFITNTQEWDMTVKTVPRYKVSIGETVTLISNGHTPGATVNFYDTDGTIVGTTTADNTGKATLTYTPSWGTHTIFTYINGDSGQIAGEWIVLNYTDINTLSSTQFVSGISFSSNGDFNVTKKTITKIADMDGLLLDLEFTDTLKYTDTYYELDTSKYTAEELNGTDITIEEISILQQAVVDIEVDDYGHVKLIRL